jgi:hypothetical protein
MRIAKYQRIGQPDWTAVFDAHADGSEPMIDTFIRVSEFIEVEFPLRKAEEIIPAQLAALKKQEEDLRAKFLDELNKIAEARANILSLTHEAQP